MGLIVATLFGAGGVPPLIGLMADNVSFSFAFGATGVATLAFLVLCRFFPSGGTARPATDEENRHASG